MTPEVIRFMREYYPTTDTNEMAVELEMTPTQVRELASRLNIRKAYNTVPEGFKLCCKCNKVLPLDEMLKTGGRYRTTCKKCRADIQRIQSIEKRLAEIERLKSLTPEQIEQERLDKKAHLASIRKGKLYTCSKCDGSFSSEYFSEASKSKNRDYLSHVCKSCVKEKNRLARLTKENKLGGSSNE